VFRLRNDRLKLFKERIQIASEKKTRAMDRKAKYQQEMQLKDNKIAELESEIKVLFSTIDSLKRQAEIADSCKASLETSLSLEKDKVAQLNSVIESLNSKIERLGHENASIRDDHGREKADWELERQDLQKSLRKLELNVEILRNSAMAKEKRSGPL
jgi:chromosome segregation ATPase